MKQFFKPIICLSMALITMNVTLVSCHEDHEIKLAKIDAKYNVDKRGKIQPKEIQQVSAEEFYKLVDGSALTKIKCIGINKYGELDPKQSIYVKTPDYLLEDSLVTEYWEDEWGTGVYTRNNCYYSDNKLQFGEYGATYFQIISLKGNELVVLNYNAEITYKCLKGDEKAQFIELHKDYGKDRNELPILDSRPE